LSRLLDAGLENLSTTLIKMGEIAENAVVTSIEGFLNGIDVINKVRSLSEALVSMRRKVEDDAFELIARYQPVASDLRILKSYMKIAYDLERYGRYALDISFDHKTFAKLEKGVLVDYKLEQLAEKVAKMVHMSITALKGHDAKLSKKLAGIENEVDELYMNVLKQFSRMPIRTKSLISNVLVVRYLERIADHATYIGESLVYIATGERVILR